MRIAIFTAEDYTFLFNAWCSFIDKSNDKYEIVGIFVFPDKLKGKSGVRLYWEYLKIMGLVDFIKLAIKTVLYEKNTKNKKYKNFQDLGDKNNIPVFYKDSPNADFVVSWVEKNNVDIIFITLGYIIKKKLLQAVKGMIINKHSALLPAYRGIWPVFWTIKDDKLPIGVTIHEVNEKIDKGEIFLQKKYDMLKSKSVFDYYIDIYNDMPDLLLETLNLLNSGERKKENIIETSYFSLPTKKDYQEFKKENKKFV